VFFSTALTLFVVPVAYVILARLTTSERREVRLGQPVEAD
jgi:hypothetical protein